MCNNEFESYGDNRPAAGMATYVGHVSSEMPDKWNCRTNGGAGQVEVPDKWRCRTSEGAGQLEVPDKRRCRTNGGTWSCRLRVERWS